MNKEITISPRQIAQAIDNLLDEKEQLQRRVDKAIEYINDLSLDFYDYECNQLIVGKYMINDLLEILKGGKNE